MKGVRKWHLGCSTPHCASLGYHLCLTLFSFPPFLLFLQVVIGSEPTFTSTQTHFPSFSVPAKWGPCTLPPVHPLRSGPSRLLLKVLSFNHFFKKVFFFFFPGQYKVTDHISAAFWLSDHLIKPRSILPPVFVDHLFFLGLRGEASGLSHTNPIPTKAFEVELVTCTNSQGFRAWLNVPYGLIVSLSLMTPAEAVFYQIFYLRSLKNSRWLICQDLSLDQGYHFLPKDTFTMVGNQNFWTCLGWGDRVLKRTRLFIS